MTWTDSHGIEHSSQSIRELDRMAMQIDPETPTVEEEILGEEYNDEPKRDRQIA